MKFTNGYWLLKENVTALYATEALEAEKTHKTLTVYAPPKHIETRGDTLNTGLLTMRFSSPLENIIKVRVSHFEGVAQKGPAFEIFEDAQLELEIDISSTCAYLKSGDLKVSIPLNQAWNIEWFGKDKLLTSNGSKSTGYMSVDNKPYTKDELSLAVGELVYGLGERFGPYVKNGQTVDIWNADGGTASEQAYKNVPFYLTNNGYGVFINEPGRVALEIASEKVSRVQFSVPGESLEYYIIYGPSPAKILERYTALTGRAPSVPEWTYGLWLTTSFTTSYDEKTVMSFIDGMIERNIPLSVFHFDCFWMKAFHWTDFVWDSQTFPDPKGMISRIKEKGIKTSIWINPYIAQRSPLFAEGMHKGYLLKKTDGSVWQTNLWQAGMGIVDFSNPDATKWYCSYLEKLVDLGIDAFKTDFGERIPAEEVTWFDGGDPEKWHNWYPYAYNKAVFNVLETKLGKGQACLFARSATAGCQQFPVHWGGDCESSYEAMAESLRGGLSLGLSGFGYWSHDIGGFEGTPPADLFKRWLAFGLLSSHSRLHGSNSYRVPWNVDEESVAVTKQFVAIKKKLMPYLLKTAEETQKKGIPIMRSMFLQFPEDRSCEYLDRQYMLGSDVLVAPIFSSDNWVEYYIPQGEWVHLIDRRTIEGGRWITEQYDFMSLPLWCKKESELAAIFK